MNLKLKFKKTNALEQTSSKRKHHVGRTSSLIFTGACIKYAHRLESERKKKFFNKKYRRRKKKGRKMIKIERHVQEASSHHL